MTDLSWHLTSPRAFALCVLGSVAFGVWLVRRRELAVCWFPIVTDGMGDAR